MLCTNILDHARNRIEISNGLENSDAICFQKFLHHGEPVPCFHFPMDFVNI